MAPLKWKVARHGPLVSVTDGVWLVQAELEHLPIGRQMTVVRTAPGELLVHSAVACDEATMMAIDALGAVTTILVPSASHKMDAPLYAARYPQARVLTTAASRKTVEKVVSVHTTLEQVSGSRIGSNLRFELLDGVPQEAVLIHADPAGDTTLVFNDALMNLPDRLPGFMGWVTRLIGSTGGPKVTGTARWFIVRDRHRLRAHLERLATLPNLRRIIVGHGEPITENPAAVLRRVAHTLT